MQKKVNLLESAVFRQVMYFKFFMVIVVWGLFPLLIPKEFFPYMSLYLSDFQVLLVRIWGLIVLLDFFVYFYIYKYPYSKWSKYLLLFGVLDNAGLGFIVLICTLIYSLPWSIWVNIPFQLFFGFSFGGFTRQRSTEPQIKM